MKKIKHMFDSRRKSETNLENTYVLTIKSEPLKVNPRFSDSLAQMRFSAFFFSLLENGSPSVLFTAL